MFDPNQIAQYAQQLAVVAVPFLLGITCHEVAHGYVSYLLGDPTAKLAGRLSLNPLKHLDPIGTLVLVLTRMIGWAKPVPINPAYYKDYRRGVLYVSLAGPLANFILMFLFALLLKLLVMVTPDSDSVSEWWYLLLPAVKFAVAGIFINAILGAFNLLPIPPLDGSKVLTCLLPPRLGASLMRLEPYGFFILLLLAVTDVLQLILAPVANLVQEIFIIPLL